MIDFTNHASEPPGKGHKSYEVGSILKWGLYFLYPQKDTPRYTLTKIKKEPYVHSPTTVIYTLFHIRKIILCLFASRHIIERQIGKPNAPEMP